MRIVYVTSHFAPQVGGVETHVHRLAGSMATLGWEVEVLTPKSVDGAPSVEQDGPLTIRRFRSVTPGPSVPLGVVRYLRSRPSSFDIVHSHNYHAPAAALAMAARKHPLVFTPHYHGTGHSPVRRLLHRPYRVVGQRLFDSADAVVAVSNAEAQLIGAHFDPAPEKVTVIPNGIDAEPIREAEPFPRDTGRRIVLAIARLEAYKGVDRVVRALASMPDAYELRIIGEGPMRENLESEARAAGVGDRTSFCGRVSDLELRRWLRTADVVVSMSSNESFGIVPTEAAVAGAAVVCSDIPAHKDLAESLPDAQIRLVSLDITDAGLSEVIRAAAEAREDDGPQAVAPASWLEVARRTASVYERLLDD
jgi:glycosyltransferase involved in cell wall biosynthesis